MDYAALANFHWEKKADITVAVQPVAKSEAGRLGLLKRDADCRITRFAEKPKDAVTLEEMRTRDDENKPYLGFDGYLHVQYEDPGRYVGEQEL